MMKLNLDSLILSIHITQVGLTTIKVLQMLLSHDICLNLDKVNPSKSLTVAFFRNPGLFLLIAQN